MFSAISGDFIDEPARQEAPAISSEVAEQARAGDSQAFTTLFQTYNSQICTYLARLVGNDEVGRDLAQETFMRAWESLPAMDQPLHFKPWLYRIATNCAKSYLRRTRLIRWLSWKDEETGPLVPGPEERTGETECVQQAMASLSPQCRTCLLLQLVGGFSQREIAELLHISEKSVSAYVSRGREQFRREYRRRKGETA
jgi:RNA polymerase sigma-70 factor (ECF subfamily)